MSQTLLIMLSKRNLRNVARSHGESISFAGKAVMWQTVRWRHVDAFYQKLTFTIRVRPTTACP